MVTPYDTVPSSDIRLTKAAQRLRWTKKTSHKGSSVTVSFAPNDWEGFLVPELKSAIEAGERITIIYKNKSIVLTPPESMS